MNKIELTYKRNSANKFDFKAIQNGNLIYGKTARILKIRTALFLGHNPR